MKQPKMKKIFLTRPTRVQVSEKDVVKAYPKGEILTLTESHANELIGSNKAEEHTEERYKAFMEEEKKAEKKAEKK